MSNLENVTVETMRLEIKRREAKDGMQRLFVQYGDKLESKVKEARTLVYLYDKSNRVLNPPTVKRGRKAKTS